MLLMEAEETLQANLIRSCSVHVLRAVMHPLKLNMGGGRLMSWVLPFLPTLSSWNHITGFLQAAISIYRLKLSTLMRKRDSVFKPLRLRAPGPTSCALRHECAWTKDWIISGGFALELWVGMRFVEGGGILFEIFSVPSVCQCWCVCRLSLWFTFT